MYVIHSVTGHFWHIPMLKRILKPTHSLFVWCAPLCLWEILFLLFTVDLLSIVLAAFGQESKSTNKCSHACVYSIVLKRSIHMHLFVVSFILFFFRKIYTNTQMYTVSLNGLFVSLPFFFFLGISYDGNRSDYSQII